ncbi:MAG TPA: IPT/TIG domain-containing protein [Candidatus Dormibacteraeota bacterium]
MLSRPRLLLATLAAFAAATGFGVSTVSADSSTVTVTSVSPNRGEDSGGETVTIKGTGFWCNTGGQTVQDPATGNNDPNPNDYLTVTFGSNAATISQVDNDGQMEVTTPSGEGTVDVVAKCVQGAASASATSSADRYTYINTVSGAAGSANQGGSGADFASGSGSSASGPTSLAQTGGGPSARPVANASPAPAWLLLVLIPILAGAALFRRRRVRR